MKEARKKSDQRSQNVCPEGSSLSDKAGIGRGSAFKDTRSEAALQRKIQRLANECPQAKQMRVLQRRIGRGLVLKKTTQFYVSAPPIQRVTNEEVATAKAACNADSATSVERYSKGWKTKPNATKKRIFETVHANESKWHDNVDHIMKGEAVTPPAGYHSKALEGAANAEGTGTKSPSNVGGKGVYKQWTKRRGQEGNGNLKISTFFPDNWDELKVRACALLSFVGESHQMTDQKALDSPGDATFYPTTGLENPDAPG